jgi:hypothetical protein
MTPDDQAPTTTCALRVERTGGYVVNGALQATFRTRWRWAYLLLAPVGPLAAWALLPLITGESSFTSPNGRNTAAMVNGFVMWLIGVLSLLGAFVLVTKLRELVLITPERPTDTIVATLRSGSRGSLFDLYGEEIPAGVTPTVNRGYAMISDADNEPLVEARIMSMDTGDGGSGTLGALGCAVPAPITVFFVAFDFLRRRLKEVPEEIIGTSLRNGVTTTYRRRPSARKGTLDIEAHEPGGHSPLLTLFATLALAKKTDSERR